MRSLIALLTLLLLIFAPAAAQSDTDTPRLRIAPSDEILTTLQDLIIYLDNNPNHDLKHATYSHLSNILNHPDSSLSTLLTAFPLIFDFGMYPANQWGHKIIGLWLSEQQPDFTSQPNHSFDDFIIESRPLDFNSDSKPEWVLKVTTESGIYRQLLFAKGDTGSLFLIESPLPWYSNYANHYIEQWGEIEPQRFQDLTGDGQPEWVLASGTWLDNAILGRLIVIQWHNDGLREIASIDLISPSGGMGDMIIPWTISFEYLDLDNNGTVEIIIHDTPYFGAGDCPVELIEKVTVFGWDEPTSHYKWVDSYVIDKTDSHCMSQQTPQAPISSDSPYIYDNVSPDIEPDYSEKPQFFRVCYFCPITTEEFEMAHADLAQFADDPEYGAVVRYHYAWALNDAGFFDDSEVAAAYQSVIDFAPDSPWARLAALHVE